MINDTDRDTIIIELSRFNTKPGRTKAMKLELVLLLAVASVSTSAWAQKPGYPITVVPPGKGPYQFPPAYQTPWDKIEMLVTEKLSPNLYALHGSAGLDSAHPDAAGGRVVVLFGSDGVLMVDTEDPQLAAKTLDTIRTFTSAPIKIVVNSHIHPDHTGGNAFFAKQGAVIFSQENLRDEMLSPPGQGNANRALDPAGVPTLTYQYGSPGAPAVTIHMNGETVDFIPMMPSHTAGDTIVRFNQANVIYIEDFYRNFGYPFADQANGGSIQGMIEAVDLIEQLAGPDTTLVPGHGTLVRKKDLLGYRAMLVDILGKVQKFRDEGKSLDEVLAADLTAPYDASTLGDTKQSKDRFITEVYDEVKDFPPVVNGERKMPRRSGPGR
jgi:cyclase